MKNTYLSAKYYSLVGRRGKKRALIAVGHKILIMAYQILKTGIPYKVLLIGAIEPFRDRRNGNWRR
jgi:hypothetical protein